MKDDEKTKEQLVNELALMRHRVAELKQTDSQDNRSDEALRMLVEGTASATGDEFFRSLVCNLAHALRVRYAFVSEFAEVTTRVRTLASWVGDGFLGSFEYDLADTPCEKILRGETRHYPEGVQALFPKDTYLVELGAESYLAMPLVDPAGEVLGHLAVIDDKPLPEDPRSTSVFRIFAARAGAELVRKRAEEALRRQAERLRVLRDMDQAILASRSPETIAQAALRHIRRLVPCHRTSVTLFDFETDVFTVLAADVSGGSRVVAGACFPLGTIPDIEAIRQGTVRIVDDILGLAEPSPRLQVLKGEGLRCYVATPLVSQGEVIGALNLGADHPGAFVPEHVDIAGEVADSVAVAIQNARLFEQVHAASERLQNLSRQLVEVQETERRHIARELHDEIGQVLTGLKLTLEMNTRLSNEGLAEAKALVNDLIRKVRELSLSLRPAMLDDFGLLAALLWHFERYTVATSVHVMFLHNGLDGRRFRPEVETAVYRIVQEALTNVARHAGVREVTVRLWTDQITLHVQIQDHGTGFEADAVEGSRRGGGLGGMRERAALLNGYLRLESAAGSGTRLTAELPLGKREEKGKSESGTGDGQDYNSAGG